jgi:hypothetical protein
MRGIIAFCLIMLLAINWYGYDVILHILSKNAGKTIAADFEQGNYRQEELLEIKVDLELPYSTDWESFEKISGTISVEGVVYNFVERKLENGHMVYHCLPNYKSTSIQNARDYFHTLVYNLEKQESKKSVPTAPAFKKLQIETTVHDTKQWVALSTSNSSMQQGFYIQLQCDGFGKIPSQPPDA